MTRPDKWNLQKRSCFIDESLPVLALAAASPSLTVVAVEALASVETVPAAKRLASGVASVDLLSETIVATSPTGRSAPALGRPRMPARARMVDALRFEGDPWRVTPGQMARAMARAHIAAGLDGGLEDVLSVLQPVEI